MNTKNLSAKNTTKRSAERRPAPDGRRYLTPAVDIFETESGLTLVADLPGIAGESLKLDIAKGVLTLEGHGARAEGRAESRASFAVPGYYRQFQLPEDIDADRGSAELKDGVLTLRLPRAAAARPRRIEVSTVH